MSQRNRHQAVSEQRISRVPVGVVLTAIVIFGLLATGAIARLLADAERERQQALLARTASQATGEILARFGRHEVQLLAARALFEGSTFVSRAEWRDFTAVFLEPSGRAGFFELAWLPRVDAESLASVVARARDDGLTGFTVYPPSRREFHCPILYNEPQQRHAASLGRDACLSEAAYPAMRRARSGGEIALSESLGLGMAGEAQSGYVMFAWVDGNNRQSGWVAGTMAARELFDATLAGPVVAGLTVVDVSSSGENETVFRRRQDRASPDNRLGIERQVALGGREFHLRFIGADAPTLAPRLLFGAGTIITLLLAGFLYTQLRARARALELADSMTRAWRESEELLSSITHNIQEGIYRGVPNRGLVYVNQALAEMFGFDSPEAMMAHAGPMLYASPRERERLRELLERDGHYRNREVTFMRPDGSRFVAVNSAVGTRDEQGRIRYFDGVIMDITERKDAEEQVHRLAHYDSLTELPNRALSQTLLERVLDRARRRERPFAVMFIDLDRFKLINDSLGHGIGDKLLVAVARRLSDRIRDDDVLSRQSGDEFLLVLPDIAADVAAHRAEDLLKALGERPFKVDGHDITVTPSIGIAMFPDDGDDAETLIRHADAAMYHAKERGRSTFEFFTAQILARGHERLTMESHLRGALAREELSLVYQPVIDLEGGRINGVEALLRWNSPELGQVAPSEFIPVAEQSGLIVEIGDWVIDSACRQMAQWREQGQPELSVAVNVSAVQFWRGNLEAVVSNALARWHIEPKRLVIELTESVIMHDVESASRVLAALKHLGAGLAIDDFGTGYSSLGYLRQFKIDLLKIDRSFIRDVDADPDAAAIVTAMLSVAHDLRMQVVAEGIEHHGQLQYLRSRGCHFGQGFLFGRPMPPEGLPDFVATWQAPETPR